LAQNTPSAANIRRYAEIVRDRSVLRALVQSAMRSPPTRSRRTARDQADSRRSRDRVFQIAEQGARGRQVFVEIEPLLTRVVQRIQELFERANPSDVTGVPTGFCRSRSHHMGLQPGTS